MGVWRPRETACLALYGQYLVYCVFLFWWLCTNPCTKNAIYQQCEGRTLSHILSLALGFIGNCIICAVFMPPKMPPLVKKPHCIPSQLQDFMIWNPLVSSQTRYRIGTLIIMCSKVCSLKGLTLTTRLFVSFISRGKAGARFNTNWGLKDMHGCKLHTYARSQYKRIGAV